MLIMHITSFIVPYEEIWQNIACGGCGLLGHGPDGGMLRHSAREIINIQQNKYN